jgi:hypothetical protein
MLNSYILPEIACIGCCEDCWHYDECESDEKEDLE